MKYLIMLLFSFNLFAQGDSDLLIEHQMRLCDDDQSVLKKFELTDLTKNKLQKIFYLETHNHDFQTNFWSIRFRVRENEVEITTKLRSDKFIHSPPPYKNVECEYDLHGTAKEYACKINSLISNKDFKRLLNGETNWTELMSGDQLNWLKREKALYQNAFIWGTLENNRYKFDHPKFGTITIDLVHPTNQDDVSYHEISIRYKESKSSNVKELFTQYVKESKVLLCPNQLDWQTDKFQIMTIQN